jgi:hypothetical protein
MLAYPSVDESLDRLHRAGWSVGEAGTATGSLVLGTNGENLLEARGASQTEAWWRAYEQARAVGMLAAFHAGCGEAEKRRRDFP